MKIKKQKKNKERTAKKLKRKILISRIESN